MELTASPPRLRTFLLVAAGLLVLLFWDALASGRVLSQANLLYQYAPWSAHAPADIGTINTTLGDASSVFLPFLQETARQVREGRLPLWSPRLFGGHPFLASFQTAVFSPFTWPAFALPLVDALLVAAVLKLVVGGLGMWLLLRALGLTPGAVLFGAVAYLLNAFSVVWLEHPLSAVAAWLPWLLWSVERVTRSGTWRDVAILSATAAACLLAGHPETTYKVGLLAAAYAFVSAWLAPRRVRAYGQLAGAALLALALAAIQLLPFFEYLQVSGVLAMRRAVAANPYPAPLETLVTAIVPQFFGNPAGGLYLPMQNPFGVPSNFCEQQVYAGIPVWLLAAVAVAGRWREWRVRLFTAAAIVSALLMYGTPGVLDAFLLVPGAGIVVLTRFGSIVIAAAVVLAALGLDLLLRDGPAPLRGTVRLAPPVAAAAMAAGVAAFLVWARPFLHANGLWTTTVGWSAFAVALMVLVCAGVWHRVRVTAAPGWLVPAAVALVAIDLLALGFRFHPMMPRAAVLPETPEIARARQDAGLWRVAGIGTALAPNAAMLYGLADVRGYDGMTPLAHEQLLTLRHAGGSYVRIGPGDDTDLLDLLNVRYVFSDATAPLPSDRFTAIERHGGSILYRNERARPRAFLVGRVRLADGDGALDLLRRGALDLAAEAVVATSLGSVEAATLAPADAGVRVLHYEDTRVVVDVDTPTSQLLVLSDLHYPGWRASVGERTVTIHRTNHALRGVVVPAGRHVVTFSYEPASVRLGMAVSLLGCLLLAGLVTADVGARPQV